MRAACAVRMAINVAVWYLVLYLFFPHFLLVPLVSAACALVLVQVLAPSRVLLDLARGDVGFVFCGWTRHIPLARIESVDQIFRFGAEITAGRVSYSYAPFRKPRGWMERHLSVRTGFEGMEIAIMEAAERARAEAGFTAPADRSAQASYPAALACFLVGFALIGVALLVQPQTGETVVHVGAVLLTVWLGMGAAAGVLIGTGLLVSRIRRQRLAA